MTKAEERIAETIPTTFRGIEASVRWYKRFLDFHDGPDNLNGYSVLETWPRTIFEAFRAYDLRPDPTQSAVSHYERCRDRLNAHKGGEADGRRLEQEYFEAKDALIRTTPRTQFGLAHALEALADGACGDVPPDQDEWLRRLVAAARALALA